MKEFWQAVGVLVVVFILLAAFALGADVVLRHINR